MRGLGREFYWQAAGAGAAAVMGFVVAVRAERSSRPAPTPPAGLGPRVPAPMVVQEARAQEQGRGRGAAGPLAIPWRGWRDILLRTYREALNDRLFALAAGVTFFSLLALFPALTAGVSLYGLFASAKSLGDHVSLIAGIAPAGAIDIIGEQIARVVQTSDGKLTFRFLFGLALALWSANASMKAMFDALNIINEEVERRGFVKLNAVSLLFTAGAIVLALLTVSGVVAAPLVLGRLGLGAAAEATVGYGRWPLMLLLILFALGMVYRFGPSRQPAKWRWLSIGSLAAAACWMIVSAAFSFYLARFADYDATYGSLGAAIGLLMWMWLSMIVVLLGAELNAEIEHQTACDSTTGAPQPLGQRGAIMADTVGAAQD